LPEQGSPVSPHGRGQPPEERLDSWKEIAAYLRRGVSTVQRWEQNEGLPVHRHPHEKRGSVYAFKREIDQWRQRRRELDDAAGDEPSSDGERVGEPSARARHGRTPTPATVLLVVVGVVSCVAAALAVRSRGTAKPPSGASTIQLGLTEELQDGPGSAVAISPDGQDIVYVAWRNGVDQLYGRSVAELEARAIAGTEYARAPFFSPDGRWVGFFASGHLKKVRLQSDGVPVSICAVSGNAAGATWAAGRIVFATFGSALMSVPEGGGEARPITSVATDEGEIDHRWPALAPDGATVVFTIWSGAPDTAHLAAQSLPGGKRRVLSRGSHPRWARGDHVVFAWADALWAVPFDARGADFPGPSVRVVDSVQSRYGGAADFDVSQEGALVYLPSRAESRAVVWVDLHGNITPILPDRGSYSSPRISPDGTQLAIVARARDGARDIWIHDLRQGTRTQLTKEGASFDPVWGPDGREILYASARLGPSRLFRVSANGSSAPQHLNTGDFAAYPLSWSPDGRLIAYHEENTSTGHDLWIRSADGTRVPFRTTPFSEIDATFSPDGRALAYASNESGRFEVYVEPFPSRKPPRTVSTGGGCQPRWSRDGRALYYRALDGRALFQVAVTSEPSFESGRPALLFEGAFERFREAGTAAPYDVAADGRRFVFIGIQEERPPQIHILSGWLQGLSHRSVTKQ
jgi:eukaryotic-like serine/threonine-protein kinase